MSAFVTPSATVRVGLDHRGYDILIGRGLIGSAGRAIGERLPGRPLVVLTDGTVAELHLDPLMRSLTGAGLSVAEPVVVPAGEASKDMTRLASVLDALLARGVERRTLLVALGGGVVGDLGGFAAAICLRGIDFVQIPTTLLAQVDSAVGGKTGVNSPYGKNLIGAFHQPRLVLSDMDTLASLAPRELRAGYAEVVKYGLIDQPDFFDWLEANAAGLLAGDADLRAEAVRHCCAAKAAVVEEDEREAGRRELLNLGHTFGHALEAAAGYGEALRHGEAVAIGMVMAFDLSARLGLCPEEDAARVRRHLAGAGLPVSATALPRRVPKGDWRPEALVAHMGRDKKVRDGRPTFILARGIGRAFRATPDRFPVPQPLLTDLLAESLAPDGAAHRRA